MSTIAATIRDQVKDVLAGASLSPAVTPVTLYDLAFSLAELQGGRLTIMPQTKDLSLLNRGGAKRQDVKIDVAVQYKYAQPTSSELDPYLALAESVPDYFLAPDKKLECGAQCTEASFPHGLFLPEHIKEFRVFTSVVTLTFVLSI